MIAVVFFWFFLFSFWAENVLGFKLTSMLGLSLQNISFFLLFLAWAMLSIRAGRFFRPSRVNTYLVLLGLVIVASIPIKLVLNEVPNVSLFDELVNLKGWLDSVLPFVVLYNTLDKEKHCRLALVGLLVFFAVTVLSTIGVTAGFLSLGTLKVVQEGRSAGFAEPNQYAAYIVLFIPLLFSGVLFPDARKRRLSLVGLFLALLSLLATGSRGGMIALFFTACVYGLVFSAKKLVKPRTFILALFLAAPILGVSAFFVAPDNVRETVVERFDPTKAEDSYELTSGRTTLWKHGLQLFLESPLYGHGQATFIPLMKENFHVWGNSHNDYLLYLVHYGVIGLGLFLMVLWSLFRESWSLVESSSDKGVRILALSYVSGLAGFAIAMFGVNVIQPMMLFWAYSAVILRYGRLSAALPGRA